MQLDSRLQKSRHGIYSLRIQRHGLDRRWSLRTRDPLVAAIHAHELSAKLLRMKNNPTRPYSGFTLKVDGDKYELTTEDNDSDRADGTAAFLSARQLRLDEMRTQIAALDLAEAQSKIAALELALTQVTTPVQSSSINPNKGTITLEDAIKEYEVVLEESDLALKSKRMASSVLAGLMRILGTAFNMYQIDNLVIKNRWYKARLETVSKTTAKRDLSFIRGFVIWAADEERKYCKAELTFTIEAKGENYDYFTKNDLKLIFDNLPSRAENSWQFWIPILGLYTGGRIAEIASLRTDYVSEKSELNVLRLAGTKTDESDRTIPIHPDLIKLGFLEYVKHRSDLKHETLFDITHSKQNGAGAQSSKWFTAYKADIGLVGELKVFHSFRHTITDLMNQASVNNKAGSQYTGHVGLSDVRNGIYGRNPLSLEVMQAEVVDKINWQKYCSWAPDIAVLKAKADGFLVKA